MAFTFRYEKVLKFREDEEFQKKNQLGVCIAKKEGLVREKAELESKKEDFVIEKYDHFLRGLKASDLQFYQTNEAWFKDEFERLSKAIREAELAIITARIELVKATQEKKKFEKLKERAVKEFEEAQNYAEAQLVDQIVTFNATKNRQGD